MSAGISSVSYPKLPRNTLFHVYSLFLIIGTQDRSLDFDIPVGCA